MNIKVFFLILCLSACFFESYGQEFSLDKNKQYTPVAIGFWNVENFYDTLNDPLKNDEEFLPDGTYAWGTMKYKNKLEHLSTVISMMGTESTPDGLAVLGVCEIENKTVLQDLANTPKLKSRKYKIAHIEGPDRRGVDVAMLYNPKYFSLTSMSAHTVKLVTDNTYPTRDELLVNGKLLGEDFHFIICHWPSRRGGTISEVNRIAAAKVAQKIIDSLLTINAQAKIILMGDLNDDPTDKSVKTLNTVAKAKDVKNGTMFNAMETYFKRGIGTLAYNDSWNLFDQQIMTPALVQGNYKTLNFYSSHIFDSSFVKETEGKYKGYPLRTHSGGTYTNGYSDHFSVYSIFLKEHDK
ncbi:MAG: hypothetical protein JST67_04890 [Bacteroidetes bacterium]|nr:hypothetical protein [Bacteroidota bacterium]